MCVYDTIKDHFNYKFIEKKLFHEYEYESEYGSNAYELACGFVRWLGQPGLPNL